MNNKLFFASITTLAVVLSLSVYKVFDHPNMVDSQSKDIPPFVHTLYSKWKSIYGKEEGAPSDHLFRIQEFYRSIKLIKRSREENPENVYQLTHLSDTTNEEFLSKYANKKHLKNPTVIAPETPPPMVNLLTVGAAKVGKSNRNRFSFTSFRKTSTAFVPIPTDGYNIDKLDKYSFKDVVSNQKRLSNAEFSQGISQTCYSFSLARAVESEINSDIQGVQISSAQFVNCAPKECIGKQGQGG